MRIFLPLTPADRVALETSSTVIELEAGRAAWAVTASVREDQPGEDEEDLEYEAMQDAAHIALVSGSDDQRALVLAADVPDRAVGTAEDTGGAYGVVLLEAVAAPLASAHVTEQTAAQAEVDDTDPALLWLDTSEGPDALAYLDATR